MLNKTIRDYMSQLGKMSLKTMTAEQRKERAKKAVAKRWENYKKSAVDKSKNK